MQTLMQDVRYAVRSLLKRPGFVVIAVTTLALGIGATTAIFTVVNSVLLRPLAFPQSESIVAFEGINPSKGFTDGPISVPDFADWKNQSQSFEQMAAFVPIGAILVSNDEPERVHAAYVTTDFFPLLRTAAFRGRALQPDDYEESSDYVALLSYGLWQRRFGGSESLVGQKVVLGTRSFTIIGVMPPGFDYPERSEIWLPYAPSPERQPRDNRFINVIGRLKPGVTFQQAQVEMTLLNERLAQSYPVTNYGQNVKLSTLQDKLVGDLRTALLVLLGAVAFVLLIACANVVNLQLSRATYREREIAVRTALGASRLRIIRQLLTESVLLAIVSGIAGIGLSVWLTKLLIAISPPNSPRFEEIAIDARVFVFALAIALITGVVFGLAPALKASRTDINDTLKDVGCAGLHGRRNRIGGALMISEIALSFMLLVGAGLLIKSFIRLLDVKPGFEAANTLTMRLQLPSGKYIDAKQNEQIYRQIVERVGALPGVTSAGAILSLPLRGSEFNLGRGYVREGRPLTPEESGSAFYLAITPSYFQTVGIPLKSGRLLNDHDTSDTPMVAVINETMARKLWPGEDPIGRKFIFWRDEKFYREIVGVVGDTRVSLDTQAEDQVYVPHAQSGSWSNTSLVVKTNSEPTALASAIRNEILATDRGIAIYNLKTLEDVVATSAAPRKTPMLLLASFATTAMLLAMLGIYGVTAYYVTQHTHEIGVRMALGAQMKDVLKLVLRRGILLALAGIAIGAVVALALTRYLRTLLFEVRPIDLPTFLIVGTALILVALIASVIPARRAAKIDPLVALRYE